MTTIQLGGRGGQRPGERGEDGASINGGVGGKGGRGGDFPDEYPSGFRDYMLNRRPTHLVYVAGPFSAPDRAGVEANIQRASEAGVAVAKLGFCPVIPHANTAHPDFETVQPYQFWIDATAELLRRCDCVLMIEGWERSSGARAEKAEAERLGLPVFLSLGALAAYSP